MHVFLHELIVQSFNENQKKKKKIYDSFLAVLKLLYYNKIEKYILKKLKYVVIINNLIFVIFVIIFIFSFSSEKNK